MQCAGLLLAARLLLAGAPAVAAAASNAPKAAPVNVTLFAEALCPYWQFRVDIANFLVDTLVPLLDKGFERVLNFRYVAWGNARRDMNGSVQCQHGSAECRLNRMINCATDLHPAQGAWLPFAACLEGTPPPQREAAVDGCSQQAGWDPADLHGCAEGEQGQALEKAAEAETAALIPPHLFVPWVLVNGIPLGEDVEQLWRYVCVAYTGERPETCYASPSATRQLGVSWAGEGANHCSIA